VKQVIDERLDKDIKVVDLLQLSLEASELLDKSENSRSSFKSNSELNVIFEIKSKNSFHRINRKRSYRSKH
jgi:hypothetical protein